MKIDRLTMIDKKDERVAVRLEARIEPNGDLVLDGCDRGALVEEHFGADDYEYALTLAAEYKDTALLYLVRERFAHDADFRKWLDEKGIPSTFETF